MWKLFAPNEDTMAYDVSEGLNSVETCGSEDVEIKEKAFQKDLIVWKHAHLF